ncbi:ABC transporter ATP-binding protein [Bariatricus sp. SGI.154]|uniref:ABC transporter ATP-binding protein n=1 Tax=Bariatricus sp. SGI.154 TaxID=3420549 RepID=UPI003D07ECFC
MSEKVKKAETGKGHWHSFWNLLKKIHLPWHWIIIAFLCNFCYNKVMLKLPTVSAGLMSGSTDSKVLWDAIMFYVLFTIVLCADVALRSPARHIAARNVRRVVWKKMLHIRMDYYDSNDPSDMMSVITNDATTATELLVEFLVGFLPTVYYAVTALKTISSYNVWLMLSVFILLPVKIIYTVFVGRWQYKTQFGVFSQIGNLTAYLAERVRSLSLIKTYTNEEKELKNGENAAYGLFDAYMQVNKLQCVVSALSTLIGMAQTMAVMVFGVILLKLGDITLQQWIAFFMFSSTLSTSFDNLINYWMNLKMIQGTLARTSHLLMAPEEEDTVKDTKKPEGTDIVFENVSFAYGDKKALKNISFQVPAGSSTAIIGLCGSGKTTSLSLLEHFYEPSEGKVTLGGVPVSEMTLDELRGYMGYVQQGADIFSGTAREALTYGLHREVSDDEIWKAAEKSGFAEILRKWESGLDTPVAPGGTSMSGGQRQKLVLTREFMRDTDILLLDEPTSALDAAASKLVQDTIFEMFPNRTKIMVTHDLSLIERVDQIIVLHNGVLAGCGNYSELYGNCEAFMDLIAACEAEKEAVQ